MKNEILLEEYSNTMPMQVIEAIAKENNWQVKKHNNDEISLEIGTGFGSLGMFFMWSPSLRLLQISAILDIHIDTYIYPEVYELLSLINEKMLMGHFSMISGTNLPLYRNAVMLSDKTSLLNDQIMDLIDVAMIESHRYSAAFAEVKNGANAKVALIMAIPECLGTA